MTLVKVLHVIPSVAPESGGPAANLRMVAPLCQQAGHAIEVVSLDMPGEYESQVPYKLYAMGPHKTGWWYSSSLYNWLIDNAPNYEAIFIRGIWHYSGFAAFRAAKKCNIPYFIFTHGMLDPWFKWDNPLKHLKKWLFWPWCEYRILKNAEFVLFTSEQEKILAKESFWLYSATPKVIPYGTIDSPISHECGVRKFEQLFPHLKDKRCALFAGRIHPKKGCDLLIRAFASVSSSFDEHLIFMGPNQTGWQEQLEEEAKLLGIESRIHFLGMLEGEDKWAVYHGCSGFFLPSHQENFGIVVAEALAAGKKVYISDKVNIWQEIKHCQAGVVRPDDLAGVKELVKAWVEDSKRLGSSQLQESMECFSRHFDIRETAKSLHHIVESISCE